MSVKCRGGAGGNLSVRVAVSRCCFTALGVVSWVTSSQPSYALNCMTWFRRNRRECNYAKFLARDEKLGVVAPRRKRASPRIRAKPPRPREAVVSASLPHRL